MRERKIYKLAACGVLGFCALVGGAKYFGNSGPHVHGIDSILQRHDDYDYADLYLLDFLTEVNKRAQEHNCEVYLRAITNKETVSNIQAFLGDKEDLDKVLTEFSNILVNKDDLVILQGGMTYFDTGVFVGLDFYINNFTKDNVLRFFISDPKTASFYSFDNENGWTEYFPNSYEVKLDNEEVDKVLKTYRHKIPRSIATKTS
jgi:hypothetical protein